MSARAVWAGVGCVVVFVIAATNLQGERNKTVSEVEVKLLRERVLQLENQLGAKRLPPVDFGSSTPTAVVPATTSVSSSDVFVGRE